MTSVPNTLDAHAASDEALQRATQQDAEIRDLNDEKAAKRWKGAVDKQTGLYKLDIDEWDDTQLARWCKLMEVAPNIVSDLLAAYDRSEWSDSRSLQGWCSGRYKGKRAKKPLRMPASGYLVREHVPAVVEGR